MPWITLGAAALGAGASLYGSKKASDQAKDIADSQDPYAVALANAQVNNVNRYTPFGSVEYQHHAGKPNDPTDDRWSVNQTYSPQMQQLADSMLGIAGAAPATFESYMPTGLQSKMSEVFGSDVQMPNYTPSYDGFGQSRRPGRGEVQEGFNWQNYDESGNQVADDPYVPWSGADGSGFGDPTTDKLLQITAGETTNRQILDQLYNNGYISDYDYNTMMESFQSSGSGNNFGWGNATSPEQMLSWLPDDLHPRFKQTSENIFNARFSYDPNYEAASAPQTEADPANYDQQSLDALIQALTAAGYDV